MTALSRRRFGQGLTALGLSLASPGLLARCGAGPLRPPEPARPVRLGWLGLNPAAESATFEAFRQGLREHGYVEGQNLVIERRDSAQQLWNNRARPRP